MNKYQTVKSPSEALYIASLCVEICKYNQATIVSVVNAIVMKLRIGLIIQLQCRPSSL